MINDIGLAFARSGIVQGLIALSFAVGGIIIIWKAVVPTIQFFSAVGNAIIELRDLIQADVLDRLKDHDRILTDHEARIVSLEHK